MFHCKRCGFETKVKCNLKTHLTRKNECKCILENISRDELLLELSSRPKHILCDYCDQSFTNKSSKSRHNKTCKERNSNVEFLVKENKALRERIMLLEKSKCEITNFGNYSNIEWIDREVLKDALKNQDIEALFEHIHFHPLHPEYQNIRIRNIYKKTLEYFEEGRWVIDDTKTILDIFINIGAFINIQSFFMKHKNEIRNDLDEEYDEYNALRTYQNIKT